VKKDSMTSFSADELDKIDMADDLHVAPFRDDGATYGTPTWIWSVAHEADPKMRARTPAGTARPTASGRVGSPPRAPSGT